MNEDMQLKESFREWLASFEGDEQPFKKMCPVATWKADDPDFQLYFAMLRSDWIGKFVFRIDEHAHFASGDSAEWTPDWSDVTAKQALEVLDGLDVA